MAGMMKSSFNYQFTNLCGVSYKCGNICYNHDGTMLLTPVGNRITVYDLVNHQARTLPFETRMNIRRISLIPPHDTILVVIDETGAGVLVNFAKGTVIHRFHAKSDRIRALEASPNGEYLAISVGSKVQVWRTPEVRKEFSPLVLHRVYSGHHDDVTCIGWSQDSRYFCVGSKDTTVRIYSLNPEGQNFEVVTLAGHSDRIVACFFRYQSNPNDPFARGAPVCPVLYTISKDGSLFIWDWEWNDNNYGSEIEKLPPLSMSLGKWHLFARHYLQKNHAKIHSAAMRPSPHHDLLLVGFSNGSFTLFETPSASELQSLSVSKHRLGAAAISPGGEWLALGSSELGQLLVWEWSSETYILKQQGHFYDLNSIAYSPDGQLIATGGDDHKVKIWSSLSGFCFVTFTDHEAPVTALAFVGDGNAVLSASMDGTVRAYDLVRYRNFKTMVTPNPVQLTSLAIDGGGEIVCAGAMDPPHIFVWSLQTGRLLDVLTGHEGPISGLSFCPNRPLLASSSWDHTVRLWEPYRTTAPVETFEVGSDALAVVFRPDGREVCTSSLDCKLSFFKVEDGTLRGVIECDRDLSKKKTDGGCFTTISYTADGSCVLAAGRTRFVCLYEATQKVLLKKFQISHNRSLSGVSSQRRKRPNDEDNNMDFFSGEDSEGEEIGQGLSSHAKLPGVKRGADLGQRKVKPEARTKSIQFSPNGQAWAAATTEGMIVFSLDTTNLFDPIDLDEDVTPDSTRIRAKKGDFSKAMLMSLHLNEGYLIKEIFQAVPLEEIPLVARSIPLTYVHRFLDIISECMISSNAIELVLLWGFAILSTHNDHLRASPSSLLMQSLRNFHKSLSKHEKDLTSLCEGNLYTMDYLCSVLSSVSQPSSSIQESEEEIENDSSKTKSVSEKVIVEEKKKIKKIKKNA